MVRKDSILVNFIKGKSQVIIVISILRIGIDIVDIRYIIYKSLISLTSFIALNNLNLLGLTFSFSFPLFLTLFWIKSFIIFPFTVVHIKALIT